MKELQVYIVEKIKQLPSKVKGLIVFDIDDTLLKSDSKMIKVYKKTADGEIGLNSEEFAKDPDAGIPSKAHLWDFRDFQDPVKVYQSIIKGTPLMRNIRIMDDYIDAGYDFCFLTARACEDVIKEALDEFIKSRTKNGSIREIGSFFKKALSHAINDETKNYKGATDAEKKANVLIDLCSKYDRVIFVDDDKKNVRAAKGLKLPNLKVIKAWEE